MIFLGKTTTSTLLFTLRCSMISGLSSINYAISSRTSLAYMIRVTLTLCWFSIKTIVKLSSKNYFMAAVQITVNFKFKFIHQWHKARCLHIHIIIMQCEKYATFTNCYSKRLVQLCFHVVVVVKPSPLILVWCAKFKE